MLFSIGSFFLYQVKLLIFGAGRNLPDAVDAVPVENALIRHYGEIANMRLRYEHAVEWVSVVVGQAAASYCPPQKGVRIKQDSQLSEPSHSASSSSGRGFSNSS